jgi:hypothetical protein
MTHLVLSLRSSLATSLLGLAVLTAAAPGCSSSDDTSSSDSAKKKDIYAEKRPPVLVNEAVNADQAFADDAVVADDSITIPTAGHEAMIAKIKEGTVLAGNRTSKPLADDAQDLGPNPYGFLRKVKSISVVGPNTVLKTEKASLDEWLQDGDIDWSSTKSLLDGTVQIAPPDADGKTVTTKSLHILTEDSKETNTSGSGSAAINATLGSGGVGVKVSNAQFTMGAKYEGYMKVRYKELRFLPDPPTGVAYKSLLTLDPEVSADIEFKVTGSATLAETEWNTRAFAVPLPGPVPTTLRLEPTIKCSLAAGGEISVVINAKIGAHAATGFQGDAGFTHFDLDDISQPATPTGGFTFKSVNGKVAVTGKCEIQAKPILLAFDAIGLQGKIGPYVSIAGNACGGASAGGANGGFTLTEEHGISGEFGGRIQVPVIGVGKDFEGLGIEIPLGEHYLVGSEKTCEAPEAPPSQDSCEGKSDGFHCSEVNAYGGIVCQGGQIASGLQCDSVDKKCTGGTATTINCQ